MMERGGGEGLVESKGGERKMMERGGRGEE